MAAGAYGSRQLHHVEDEMDAFSKERLSRRPEVRFINTYVVVRTYVLTMLKGIGALVLLWATVVLLGGFVSSLQKKDFWYISFISFVQAAGLAALDTLSHTGRFSLHDYGSGNKDGSQANLKPGMDLFYFLCVAQGIIFVIMLPVEIGGTSLFVRTVSQKVGLSREEVLEYCVSTKRKYLKDLAESSDVSWNLITYGAGLLDSEMPEDNASGARVLATLIEQGTSVRRQLIRSPRPRIQKLLGTLAWTSPAEGEMRWLAAKIVEHVAHSLSLAQFPGALECVSSLLDTSGYNKDAVQDEAVSFVAQLRLDKKQRAKHKDPWRHTLPGMIMHAIRKKFRASKKQVSINRVEGTNEDLILLGMRILENLALDEHNGKVICRTDALLSKIIAPVSSENFIQQDIKINTAWAKVTDGSLKLVIQLMRSPGDTGKDMCRRVSDNSRAVKNLEEVLDLQINSSDIIVLQIRAIEILEQLCLVDSTTTSWDREKTRESLSTRLLQIFLTDKWMDDYLLKTRAMLHEEIARQLDKSKKSSKKSQQSKQKLEENKMKTARDSVIQLKEKAGDALVTVHGKPGHLQERVPVRTYKEQYEERTLQVALLSLCTAMIHGRWITVPDFASVVAQMVVSPKDLSEKLKEIVLRS
ncbi:hypothetical protein U9M48_002170 [Paspalum notatum var. saurae]|uniref:Uncharacterized protein n=1 Tax=Paspalum notatum var. saurae TaxID=547442 RepID=A0AAQ3PQT9_PASNO